MSTLCDFKLVSKSLGLWPGGFTITHVLRLVLWPLIVPSAVGCFTGDVSGHWPLEPTPHGMVPLHGICVGISMVLNWQGSACFFTSSNRFRDWFLWDVIAFSNEIQWLRSCPCMLELSGERISGGAKLAVAPEHAMGRGWRPVAAHICTYLLAYINTYIHTRTSIRPFIHPSVRSSIHPSVHPSIHPLIIHSCIYSCTLIFMMHTHCQAYMHACAYACTHACLHA